MLHKVKSKFLALSRGSKIAVIAAGVIAFGVAATATNNNQSNIPTNNTTPITQIDQPETAKIIEPKIEKQTKIEEVDMPFEKITVDDASLAAGTVKIRTAGVLGKKTLNYQVTTTDGVETDKKLVSEAVTTPPITEVTAKGTKVAAAPASSSCSPHYSGCVPIASDVDCAGGTGNGPAYARGPFNVIGSDIYDLDRDGNGVACE